MTQDAADLNKLSDSVPVQRGLKELTQGSTDSQKKLLNRKAALQGTSLPPLPLEQVKQFKADQSLSILDAKFEQLC